MTTAGSSANGQVTLGDGTSDLNAITKICKLIIARMNICKLVKVTAIHPGSGTPPGPGTVDVLPLVSQVDGSGFGVNHQTVFGLPVMRVQGGKWGIICDPAVGDYGYVVCADRDSSKVIANPGQQLPGSGRRNSLSDGIYIGGLINAAPTAYLWLKSDGTLNITDSKGNVVTSSSSGWAFTGNIVVTGTVEATDFITSGLPSYVGHTHHVTAAPGESNTPTSGT